MRRDPLRLQVFLCDAQGLVGVCIQGRADSPHPRIRQFMMQADEEMGISCTCKTCKICVQMPALHQRRSRLATVDQGPKRSGNSRKARAGVHDPQHPLDDEPMIGGWSASARLLCWQKRTKLLPLGVHQRWQAWQADCLGEQGRRQRRLTSAALYMTCSGLGLMVPAKVRPPQPRFALLLWLPQHMEQAAQFRNT